MLRRYHLILDQFGWRYPLGGEALLKHRTRYAVFQKSGNMHTILITMFLNFNEKALMQTTQIPPNMWTTKINHLENEVG